MSRKLTKYTNSLNKRLRESEKYRNYGMAYLISYELESIMAFKIFVKRYKRSDEISATRKQELKNKWKEYIQSVDLMASRIICEGEFIELLKEAPLDYDSFMKQLKVSIANYYYQLNDTYSDSNTSIEQEIFNYSGVKKALYRAVKRV